jgi:glycine/D-amino acid oxidase-like deaminating enzyme
MESVWSNSVNLPKFNTLNGDIKTDVLIIGGGMAGLLTAYFLQQKGIKYALVEGGTICSGTTKNTTAKITAQHGLIYDKIVSNSVEKAKMYIDANNLALQKYSELCQNINCDYEIKSNYVYSRNDRAKLEKEIDALSKIGFNTDIIENLPLPIQTVGAVHFPNQAQFNPLKFISEISKNLNIYEHTFVKEIRNNIAITDKGRIRADTFIIATHFPFINKHGSYFLKLYQSRSYVIALENAADINGMYVDEIENGLSFRNYNNLLLVGGGDHRTGKEGGCWAELRKFAKQYYPQASEKFHWAAQDCMSLDGIPYIGHYSSRTANMLVATGFNKWGMSSSMVTAMILSDMVQGKKNPYQEVFSPSRSILKPQLFANAFEATVNLLTFSKKRCPHLGCALKWNRVERTWDCACHGSRFDENGKVIENPATGNIKVNKKHK